MRAMAFQITGVSIVCPTVCWGADKKKTSKLRVTGLCEWKPPVTGGIHSKRASNADFFPYDNVIMKEHDVISDHTVSKFDCIYIATLHL